PEKKPLVISWRPPGGRRGVAPILSNSGIPLDTYQVKENDGKKVIVIEGFAGKMEIPYKLDGDTLTLDGGTRQVYERNAGGGFPPILVELKGEWKRVNVDLED